MSSGPCMCGDPYCPHCGSPYAAELEAAEEWLMEVFHKAGFAPDEYRMAGRVGLAAVREARRMEKKREQDLRAIEAEAKWDRDNAK